MIIVLHVHLTSIVVSQAPIIVPPVLQDKLHQPELILVQTGESILKLILLKVSLISLTFCSPPNTFKDLSRNCVTCMSPGVASCGPVTLTANTWYEKCFDRNRSRIYANRIFDICAVTLVMD